MKKTLNDINKALGSTPKSSAGRSTERPADRHVYGEVKAINEDGTYEVALGGGDAGTVKCARLVGAKVGDVVLVTILANGYAVVTQTVGGDTDAFDAAKTATDFIDVIANGNGLRLFPRTEKANPQNYLDIDNNSVDIYKGGKKVAEYSQGLRIWNDSGTVLLANIGYDYTADENGQLVNKNPYYILGRRQSGGQSGAYSMAEGVDTRAEGYASHAEGRLTRASGTYSHAEGYGTHADWNCSNVRGRFNAPTTLGPDLEPNPVYLDVVGNGTAIDFGSNAYALTQGGTGRYAGNVYMGCESNSLGGKRLSSLMVDSISRTIGTVNAGEYKEGTFGTKATKEGYTPIGIVGHTITGTGRSLINLFNLWVSQQDGSIRYGVRNVSGSTNATNIGLNLYILWSANAV